MLAQDRPLSKLLAGVAHEVKNPLNAMTIHLELLGRSSAASDRGRPAPVDAPGPCGTSA
jgi:signal transduction histidine kinase